MGARPFQAALVRSRDVLRLGSPTQIAVCLVIVLVIGIPLAIVLWGAFRSDTFMAPGAHYSLEAIRRTYGDLLVGGPFTQALINTIFLGVLVTAICMALGAAVSFMMTRTDLRGSGLMRILLITPLFYSPILDLIGWDFLLAERSGVINQAWTALTGKTTPLFGIYTFAGIVFVMVLHLLPYVVLLLLGPMQTLDSATEEASEVFGASKWQTVRLVTWPLLRPALAASGLFVLILSIEIFTIPYVLGSRIRFETVAIWVYDWVQGFHPDLPAAAAAGSVLMVLAGGLLYAYRKVTAASGSRYVTIGGKGFRSRRIALGRWRWPLSIVIMAFVATFTVVPLMAVLTRSLLSVRTTTITWADLNLSQYNRLFTSAQLPEVILNSLALGIFGALICLAAGVLIGLWKVRRNSFSVAVSDYLLMAAFGLPGILLGIGLLWTFVWTPIYLTFWILLLAVVVRFSGLAVQGVSAAAVQMDKSLQEAAESFGASPLFATFRITLPILKGTLLSLWLTLFLILLRELSMTVLLYSPTSKTLSIQAWNFTSDGNFGLASALCMIQFVLTLVVVMIWRALSRGSLDQVATGAR